MPNSIKLKDKLRFLYLDRPIVLDYKLPVSKEEFKTFIIPKIEGDELENPCNRNSRPFSGTIKGRRRDEYELKICSNFWKKESLTISFLFYVKTTETEENHLDIIAELKFTSLIQFGIWVISLLFSVVIIPCTATSLFSDNVQDASILILALFGFFAFFIGIFLGKITRQIAYFEKHLIDSLKG